MLRCMRTIDPAELDLAPLRLPPDAHKGSRGAVGILGGAPGMLGAAWLAARAALHAGAGRVYVGQIDPQAPPLDPLYPELMLRRAETLLDGWAPQGALVVLLADAAAAGVARLPLTALVVGPGMGTRPPAPGLLAAALDTPLPLVLDADALNLIAARADLADRLRRRACRADGPAATVLTPHPAEAARLLHSTADAVQADRPAAARALVERYGAVVVLKGAGSLVAWPLPSGQDTTTSGPLERSTALPGASGVPGSLQHPEPSAAADIGLARNPTGSNRLATAGTGDVLAGLLGALLARGLEPAPAAMLGVWVHGRAGERLTAAHPGASGLLPLVGLVLQRGCSDTGS